MMMTKVSVGNKVYLESLGAAVNQRDDGGLVQLPGVIVPLEHGHEHPVDPPPGHDAVQPAHHQVKSPIEILVKVLDLAIVWRHPTPGHSVVNELRSHLCLGLAHVLLSEQELSVEVGQVDGVHVNHCDISEAHQSQILKEFAAQTPSPDDQDLDVLQQEREQLGRWGEGRRGEGAASLQDLGQVTPSS